MAVWAIRQPLLYRRSDVAGSEASGDTRVGVQSIFGGASTYLLSPFKNAVLSRNLDQNMPKNAYFWEKKL